MFNILIWILVIAAAVGSAIGFKKFIWFISVGYGIAMSCCALAAGIYAAVNGCTNIATYLHCVLIVIYGLRLGLFLLIRELKNANYKKVLDAQTGSKVPIFVSILMWAYCGFLYAFEISPVAYRISNGDGANVWQWIGLVISVIGVIVEAAADRQKSAAKAIDSRKPAMTGLYSVVRCPNYFGEMTVWTGVLISGIGSVCGAQWIAAAIGYVCIIYIMVSGAFRVGYRQNKSYMEVEGYKEYIAKTPILLPMIPWYITGIKEEKPKKEKQK